jgi:hypothetical protein
LRRHIGCDLGIDRNVRETPNERIIKSIADKAAFDRVFYTTMQTVINNHPTMDRPGEEDPAMIYTSCGIGDNGDTYCRTNYESYDGQDKLVATLTFHSSGKIEKGLNAGGLASTTDIKTGETHGGMDLLLNENGELVSADWRAKGNVKTLREHW